ncbi:acireductone dioxygenase [Holotrichia oblita]|uniref:Acireductone dioxygenase n=2 Tax=Holotrichia oblita TaxID=644536 RepID=A0ACB9TCT8_HOLOL|nr:acireductone dioxygenase [Holotrichia oblita]KAI4464589.1 acireductone dioxygenase [Holotrichia oblita]
MVRAWFMSNDPKTDQREEQHLDPPKYISLEELEELTGVEYFNLDVDTYATDGVLEKIKKDRGYTYEDELVCSKECLPNYEEKLKIFYTEHLHTDEEIRFCVEGSGYFDVRDRNDKWVRVEVIPGDMLVLPSGIYHRFTLDKGNFIKARRFFKGEPVWTAHNRPADNMECRKQYVEKYLREITA